MGNLYADNEICKIALADNGFIVTLIDADTAEEEAKEGPEDEPEDQEEPEIVICATIGDLLKVLKDRLPKIAAETDEYSDAFSNAVDDAPKTKY